MRITNWFLLCLSLVLSSVSCVSFSFELQTFGRLDSSATYSQYPKKMYHLTKPRKLKAYLIGNADLDLYLYTYSQGIWTKVAQSDSNNWFEVLSFNAICNDSFDSFDSCNDLYSWFVVLKSPNTTGGDYFLRIED